jgi:hypothetical protein
MGKRKISNSVGSKKCPAEYDGRLFRNNKYSLNCRHCQHVTVSGEAHYRGRHPFNPKGKY